MYNRNLGVNYLRSYEFELKFGRSPKQWSFKNLYDLYIRAKERSEKRQKDLSKIIKKICDEIEPSSNGRINVFYYHGDNVNYFSINKDIDYGWSYSTNTVNFTNDNKVKNREDKIDFLLNNERKFELGEEMYRLERLRSYLHLHVFQIIETSVNEQLCEKFKNVKNHLVPKVLKVDIGGNLFYVTLDKDSKNSMSNYKSFEILGPDTEDIIIL